MARALARARNLAGLGTRDFAMAVCQAVGRQSLHPSIAGRGPADRLLRLESRMNDLTKRVVQLTDVVDAMGA